MHFLITSLTFFVHLLFGMKKLLFIKYESSFAFLCNTKLLPHENVLLPTREIITFSKVFSKNISWKKNPKQPKALETCFFINYTMLFSKGSIHF